MGMEREKLAGNRLAQSIPLPRLQNWVRGEYLEEIISIVQYSG